MRCQSHDGKVNWRRVIRLVIYGFHRGETESLVSDAPAFCLSPPHHQRQSPVKQRARRPGAQPRGRFLSVSRVSRLLLTAYLVGNCAHSTTRLTLALVLKVFGNKRFLWLLLQWNFVRCRRVLMSSRTAEAKYLTVQPCSAHSPARPHPTSAGSAQAELHAGGVRVRRHRGSDETMWRVGTSE